MFLTQKYKNFGSLALLARKHYCVILEFLESFWFWYKSSWTRPYNECYEHKDTLYRQTMWFTNKTLRRIAYFRHRNTHKKLACSQSFIAFSRVSDRYVKHVTDAKVQKFRLARYILCFFSSFLFSTQYNEQDHITSVTNSRTEASILGGGGGGQGGSRPPPPNENIGGGQTYRFAPQ